MRAAGGRNAAGRSTRWGSRRAPPGCAASATAPDMTIMATEVAVVSGSDHCQPMVSCDHMATPKARNTAAQQPSDTRLARTWSAGVERAPAEPGAGRVAPAAPLAGHVGVAAPRTRTLGEVGDEQLGELVAVAGAPAPGVPAQQAGRRARAAAAGDASLTSTPSSPASRRSPSRRRGVGRRGAPAARPPQRRSAGRGAAGRRSPSPRSAPALRAGSAPRTACPARAGHRRRPRCPWSGRTRASPRRPGSRGSAWPARRSGRSWRAARPGFSYPRLRLLRHEGHPISANDPSAAGDRLAPAAGPARERAWP